MKRNVIFMCSQEVIGNERGIQTNQGQTSSYRELGGLAVSTDLQVYYDCYPNIQHGKEILAILMIAMRFDQVRLYHMDS